MSGKCKITENLDPDPINLRPDQQLCIQDLLLKIMHEADRYLAEVKSESKSNTKVGMDRISK